MSKAQWPPGTFTVVPNTQQMFDLPSGELRTYLALCSFRNSTTGKCCPSFDTLAKRANCSRRTAIRHVDALSELGFIKVVHNLDKHGDSDTNQYDILTLGGVTDDTTPSVMHDTTVVTPATPRVVSQVTPKLDVVKPDDKTRLNTSHLGDEKPKAYGDPGVNAVLAAWESTIGTLPKKHKQRNIAANLIRAYGEQAVIQGINLYGLMVDQGYEFRPFIKDLRDLYYKWQSLEYNGEKFVRKAQQRGSRTFDLS